MKKLSTNEIRQLWLDFYRNHDHYIEESKSLIPVNDDSLLFINSGVATLKKYFDGSEKPPKNRIANAQKSIRTNDIENVGVTSRHHTLFEMLGNFSIGDYFKREAIDLMFEIMFDSKYFDFDLSKMFFTIHPDDCESEEILLTKGVTPNQIVKLEENFWEIGSGPGGPNLEIFYDRGEEVDARDPRELLEKDLENNRVIEVWNIVFSQYNCEPEKLPRSEYKELPQKNIDTGMGLERMAMILQDVETNYETDNFIRIINEIQKLSGMRYEDQKLAMRVISDHIRALVFSIADGILPANESRGYVIRRILRRASKYGYTDLNLKEPFLYKLVDVVVEVSQPFYEYLVKEADYVKEVIKTEEEKFLSTLEKGMDLLDKAINKCEDKVIPGEVVFKLYDTYGFPYELSEEMAQVQGYQIDRAGFEQALNAQKERAKAGAKATTAMQTQNAFLKEIITPSEFVGYQTLEVETKVNLITDLSQELKETSGEFSYLLLQECPFYAQGGGQVSDQGVINDNPVLDVMKLPNGQHLVKIKNENEIKLNQIVKAKVDPEYRKRVSKNHSATHLLHLALQKIVGENAKQAGSFQDDKRTRFDFSNLNPLTKEEIKQIQDYVNENVKQSHPVVTEITTLEEAKKRGAMTLFGEKYQGDVRMVTMGESKELCGGTHVTNTSKIGCFYIISETGIGSGIRRIEALTGENVKDYLNHQIDLFNEEISSIEEKIQNKKPAKTDQLTLIYNRIKEILLLLDTPNPEVDSNYDIILTKVGKADEALKLGAKQELNENVEQLKDKVEEEGDFKYIYQQIELSTPKLVRDLADRVLNETGTDLVILDCLIDGEHHVIVKIVDHKSNQVRANEVLKQIIEPKGGRGGGKPTMAQGKY